MTPRGEDGWGYEIGSGEAFNQAIGQILVNHSTCDWAIRELFILLLDAPPEHSEALISSQTMKAPSMAKSILAILKNTKNQYNKDVLERIESSIKNYQRYSNHRNLIAHWNWLPAEDGKSSVTLRNPMRPGKDNSKDATKEYSLRQLQDIGLGLANLVATLSIMSTLLKVTEPHLVQIAISQSDSILNQVRDSLRSLPDAPHED